MNDLHNNIRAVRCVSPVAVGTTGVGQTGVVIDRQGYGGVEFIVSYGSVTATNAVFTVTVKDGTTSGALASVADTYLLGTEADAGLAAGARTSGVGKNVTKRIGYRGNKRYVNCSVKSTVTAAAPVSISAILFDPQLAPTSNP